MRCLRNRSAGAAVDYSSARGALAYCPKFVDIRWSNLLELVVPS